MSSELIRGSCHCKSVEFSLSESPGFQFICHCDACRKLNGGMQLAGVSFKTEQLTVTGETSIYRYAGGHAEVEAHFCGKCGTPVFAKPTHYPGMVVVRGNAIDEGMTVTPVKSLFEDQACAWSQIIGAAPAD